MKRVLVPALLMLLSTVSAGHLQAGGAIFPPLKIEAGGNFYLRIQNQNFGSRQLGPWYHYWPLEAHFQTPALPEYPYWPRPQTLPNGSGMVPPMNPGMGINPAGYYAPAHWFGH